MTRPVDKSLSPELEQAVQAVERHAAKESRVARSAYAAGMKALKAEYTKRQRTLEAIEREALKEIERRRLVAVAAIEGGPVRLSDVRSVKPDDVVKSANGVSLARIACLDGSR